jgi:hypothetical protein
MMAKLSDIDSAVSDLKSAIRQSVQAAIDNFEDRTGLTPCGIEVPFIEKTALADKFARFCVGDVTISLGKF